MEYKKSTAGEYYKLSQPLKENPSLRITKFDEDLDTTSIYHMTWIETKDGGYFDCSCPASKFDCRHKGIMKTIADAKMIDSPKFYCHQAPPYEPSQAGKFLDIGNWLVGS